MAKRSTKFGTFGGVFTPSILTILGVIMYLRLPWVVGNGGLWVALGVIAAAHVISVTTGLSISSIATDKKVGAGGPYYIVSRSLGLPIGGTLGLALFVGLSFSISLYVIGFCESFLAYWGIEPTVENIRIGGTITIIALTVVTLISTSFAIKTQYVILGLIALSLISIAFSPGAPPSEGMHLQAPEGGAPLAQIFGIFFPAVTGFTAGVNMSGDLKDPKKSIPVGTMAAIGVGLIVYVSLALFLAWKIPVAGLLDNRNILAEASLIPIAVIAGIWGATLSSGLGSILGAPRILQALSSDRVTPHWFAKGHGKDAEPRRALIIAFMIGEAGILIGELDAIARVVSIFFIATYGFLNISCAIESWASTDFRPEFRIPRTVSVIGALVCVLMMIQLDIGATAGATVLFAIVFLYLKRRELALESGDTWEGVWSSLVRWGLEKLDAGRSSQGGSWRPNVIALSWREVQDHRPLLTFGTDLIRDRGVLTDFRLRGRGSPRPSAEARSSGPEARAEAGHGDKDAARGKDSSKDGSKDGGKATSKAGDRAKDKAKTKDEGDTEGLVAGLFERELTTEDPWTTARAIARFHGFAGLEPNTVLMNWAEHRHDVAGFAEAVDEFVSLDYNVLLLGRDPERGFGQFARVDLWWTPEQGSFELGLALVRFLTLSDDWRRAELRFLLLNDDPSRSDGLFKSAQRALEAARVAGTVKVLNNAIGKRPFFDWVRRESGESDLVVLGLPPGSLADNPGRVAALDELLADLGSVLVTRGSSRFEPVLQVGRGRRESSTASMRLDELGEAGEIVELAPLRESEASALAVAARELSTAHDSLASQFHGECLALIYGHDAALIDQLRGVVERAFDQLGKALSESVPLRQRKQLNKIQSGFVFQSRRILAEFESDRLAAQVDALDRRIEGWGEQLTALIGRSRKTLSVRRDPKILAANRDDPKPLRRAKRRLRRRHLFQGAQLSYAVPAGPLYGFYLRWRSPELLNRALDDAAADGYQVLIELGRSITEARHALDEFAQRLLELPAPRSGEARDGDDELPDPRTRARRELAARISERRELVVERLDKLGARIRKRREQSRDQLLRSSRRLAQGFADDLDRLDAPAFIRRHRRLPKTAEGLDARLREVPDAWRQNRQLILNRAALELHSAGFQQRLRAIVERTKDAAALTIQNGILRAVEQLRAALVVYREAIDSYGAGEEANEAEEPRLRFGEELRGEFDDKKLVEELTREAQVASVELPDAIEVLGDDALLALDEEPFEDSEVLSVSLRRLVDFLVQAEFVGGLREHTARVALAEQRAVGVAQDVIHLVSFNLAEYEGEEHEAVALAERVGPVIDNGLGRLDAELEQLRNLAPRLAERIDTQLGKILDRTEAYAITGSEDSFKLYVRSDQGAPGALRRFGGATRWAQGLSKRILVSALYRWSAGVLLARRFQASGRTGAVEGCLAVVNRNSPRPEVLDALPFYYAQPFLGQARVSIEFWVGRKQELAEIAAAVRNWKQGRKGALVITGERHSGKTSLARFTARKHFEKRTKYNLLPPRGGSADLASLRSRLAKELKLGGDLDRDLDEMFAAMPESSVLMIHDLELWWERSPRGAAVLDALSGLIERWAHKVFFILELNSHAYEFLQRLVPIADQALAVVECQPFAAEQLKEVIEVRHRATGLRYLLDEREEDELPAWNKARLFTRYFDYTGGYVGVALQSWITHIDRVDGERLLVRAPKTVKLEQFEDLRLEWTALLLQFVLHKRLTRARLGRIVDSPELEHDVATLLRMGLLTEDKQGVLEINRYMQHVLVASLRERGCL